MNIWSHRLLAAVEEHRSEFAERELRAAARRRTYPHQPPLTLPLNVSQTGYFLQNPEPPTCP